MPVVLNIYDFSAAQSGSANKQPAHAAGAAHGATAYHSAAAPASSSPPYC